MSYNLVNPTTGDLTRVAGGTLYADNPIGSIIPFGSSIIPTGYLLCNGQAVSRTTYSELFATIGTAFGAGDGSTTFNVPDMRELVPVGVGQNGVHAIETHDVYTLAQFKDDQLQDHRHANTPYVNIANGTYSTAFTNDAPEGSGGTVVVGRYGTTTHGKQMGVNYIIKAKHVGIPSDFIDAVDDAIANTTVDTVADGNMSPVTSNAVYDALSKSVTITNKTLTIPTGGFVSWSNLTGLTTQPRLAFVRLTSVYINGAERDCFVEIKSSKYGAHAVFTDVDSGLPLENGTELTISGFVYYI